MITTFSAFDVESLIVVHYPRKKLIIAINVNMNILIILHRVFIYFGHFEAST